VSHQCKSISSFGVAIVNFSSTFHIPLITYHHYIPLASCQLLLAGALATCLTTCVVVADTGARSQTRGAWYCLCSASMPKWPDDPRGPRHAVRAAGTLALAVSRQQQHQRQQQQVEGHNEHSSNSSGNSCPTGTGDRGRERSMARHYCYTDAVTQALVLATRGGACQATTRLRYFLKTAP
jgi:hypothetical protein